MQTKQKQQNCFHKGCKEKAIEFDDYTGNKAQCCVFHVPIGWIRSTELSKLKWVPEQHCWVKK